MAKYLKKPPVVEAFQFLPERKPWPPGVYEDKNYKEFRYWSRIGPIEPGSFLVLGGPDGDRIVSEERFRAHYDLAPGERAPSACPLCGNWRHEGECP